jgi:tRNA pseudouridine55 synthase
VSRSRSDQNTFDGLLLVDKRTGMTSHDVVRVARRALHQRKIGHCGTLDPEATGLLLLTLGRGTRLTRFLIRAPKVYEGSIDLGVETDTYDAAGEVVAQRDPSGVTIEDARRVMASFEGEYEQTPPPYCAKKHQGRKYYELARRGEEVPREPKSVQVFEFQPTSELTGNRLSFRLACSSGTYARSLAHHLGQELGCGAHLSSLRRTKIGDFSLEEAATVAELEACDGRPESLAAAWIPFDDIPLPFGSIEADAQQERRIRHGQTMLVHDLDGEEGDWVKVVNGRSEFIAVGTVVESLASGKAGVVQPRIVFKQ